MSEGKCKQCEAKLVVRANKSTGECFLGCSGFPLCKYTEPYPQDEPLVVSGGVLPASELQAEDAINSLCLPRGEHARDAFERDFENMMSEMDNEDPDGEEYYE